MAGVNKAIILGNLGRDPEITSTPSGVMICKFSLATSRKQKNGEEITQWHRCTAFNKGAELIGQYVHKGDKLYIEGEINYSQYEKDGQTRYSTDIIVREFNFIGGGQGGQSQGQQQGGYQPQQPPQQQGYQNQGNQGGYQPPQQNQPQYNQPGQPGYHPQNQNRTEPAPPGPVDGDDIPF